MSTSTQMGIVPKLLPVTATFAIPFILLNTGLQFNVIKQRFATSTFLGDSVSTSMSDDPAVREPRSKDAATGEPIINDPMLVATTMHKNFLENAPFAMVLAALVELNGGNRSMLTYAMGFFTVARLSHAFGINGGVAAIKFRQFGFMSSTGTLVGLAGWATYLVKGYWGL